MLLAALLFGTSLATTAQTAHPHHHTTHYRTTATRPPPSTGPKVYVCSGGSAYAYHNYESCSGLNRCTHTVNAVTVAEAEGMGRRACRKCY
ncbi:hypothetical protein E4631_15545 [Hymenobacter sp. UV11]|uniref:hypothetical protein n=1 Tax=Hymenobacter sp. UV11 TaxID=1849735 RepID=UPI00106152E9|nr:hypothetical protein [Hymenobacter sp. UV11]TDN39287.1 hypothetical protein A8B98_18685 [Hymenobacter sp. UV11]TFZ65631.1 hypothetical protein E4631_15545 [Hymenobacter sp. UV11]